jgi:hypothetical protein
LKRCISGTTALALRTYLGPRDASFRGDIQCSRATMRILRLGSSSCKRRYPSGAVRVMRYANQDGVEGGVAYRDTGWRSMSTSPLSHIAARLLEPDEHVYRERLPPVLRFDRGQRRKVESASETLPITVTAPRVAQPAAPPQDARLAFPPDFEVSRLDLERHETHAAGPLLASDGLSKNAAAAPRRTTAVHITNAQHRSPEDVRARL